MDSEMKVHNPLNKIDYISFSFSACAYIVFFSAAGLLLMLGLKSDSHILLIFFTFISALGLLIPSVWTYYYLKVSIKSVTFQKDQFILHFRNGKKIPILYKLITKIERENELILYYSGLQFDITTYDHKGVIPSFKLSKRINDLLLERLMKHGKKIRKGVSLEVKR
jgi:hypothetical protein